MSFFSAIYQSIYSRAFYRSLIDRPLSFSFSYFLAIVCVVGVCVAIFFTALSAPSFIDFSRGISSTLATSVPDTVTLTVSHGTFSTFPDVPVTIEASSQLKTFFDEHNLSSLTHFAVIDALATEHSVKDSHSLFVLSKEHLFISIGDAVEVYDVSELPDVTLNSEWAHATAARISSFARFIPVFFLILLFVFILGVGLIGLVQIFFMTFLFRALLGTSFFARLFGYNIALDPVSWWDGHLSFALLYTAFLHASTLGFLFLFPILLFLPQFTASYILIGFPISAFTVLARLR